MKKIHPHDFDALNEADQQSSFELQARQAGPMNAWCFQVKGPAALRIC